MAEDVKKKPIEIKLEEAPKPPMVEVPVPVVRWLAYTIIFLILLLPWMMDLSSPWKWASGSMILAHFASVLNGLKNDK